MDYLARETAPFSQEIWAQIDDAVINSAKKQLVCRRFLSLYGPLGAGVSAVNCDSPEKTEEFEEGFARVTGRRLIELPQLFEDFTLLWRDIEDAEKQGLPLDLTAAVAAAKRIAAREDDLILNGNKKLGAEGLLNAKGAYNIKKGSWKEGEDAFRDVAHAVAYFYGKGMLGRYALILSPDLYLDLQRRTPGMGILELDRISKLVNGYVYPVGAFGAGKAALVCADPQFMDFAVGADLSTGYLELKDFNHGFRIAETAALRIKDPAAIVIFE